MAGVADFTLGLDQPVLDGGLPAVNFFNGRLLTAGDLRAEQDAARLARERLGRVLGHGVVSGLEVAETAGLSDRTTPVVTVRPGTAVNREGAVIELPQAVNLLLVRVRSGEPPAGGGLFADCRAAQPGVYTVGAGIFVLTVRPAAGEVGRAPASGLPDAAKPACTTDRRVEGVSFRLVQVALAPEDLLDPARLRNRLAHRCFGTDDPARQAALEDPFGGPHGGYGLMDALVGDCLTGADVPLAALFWTAQSGLEFIDLWCVRRRVAPPSPHALGSLGDGRALAEAEARLLQFQSQVGDLLAGSRALDGDTAAQHFVRLPPAGLLPAVGPASPSAFEPAVFLDRQAPDEYHVLDARQLRPLLHESLAHEAIPVDGEEVVDLYVIRENQLAIRAGRARVTTVVFARRTMTFRGTARFDEAVFGSSRVRRP